MTLIDKLKLELNSIKIVMQLQDFQRLINGDVTHLDQYGNKAIEHLSSLQLFAKRAKDVLYEIEQANPALKNEAISEDTNVLGANVPVKFTMFNKTVDNCKVDTGASMSSLDARNIKKTPNGQVSFTCPSLNDNVITLDIHDNIQVKQADTNGESRPTVLLKIVINDKPLNVMFNLNDRSQMDSPILIGQDIISAGKFVIDIQKSDTNESTKPIGDETEDWRGQVTLPPTEPSAELYEALMVIEKHNITIKQLLQYLQTMAINNLKD